MFLTFLNPPPSSDNRKQKHHHWPHLQQHVQHAQHVQQHNMCNNTKEYSLRRPPHRAVRRGWRRRPLPECPPRGRCNSTTRCVSPTHCPRPTRLPATLLPPLPPPPFPRLRGGTSVSDCGGWWWLVVVAVAVAAAVDLPLASTSSSPTHNT